jgi:PAS domain-containing protein
MDWGWKVAIHPEDLPCPLGIFQEAVSSGQLFEAEGRLRRRDGEFRWFLFRGVRGVTNQEELSNGSERIPILKTADAPRKPSGQVKRIFAIDYKL